MAFNTHHHRLLREMAQRQPHIRALLPVVSVLLDALDQAGIITAPYYSWQLAIGADHIGKFRHASRSARHRSHIQIVRRDGQASREFYNVADAVAFHRHPRLP
jgi:hypothetical protein